MGGIRASFSGPPQVAEIPGAPPRDLKHEGRPRGAPPSTDPVGARRAHSIAIRHPVAFYGALAGLAVVLVALLLASAIVSPVRAGIGIGDGPWRLQLGIVFWIVLSLISETMYMQRPTGGTFSVSDAPLLAVAVLGGPLAAGLVALLGSVEIRELGGRVPWYGVIGSRVGVALPAVVSGYLVLTIIHGSNDPVRVAFATSAGLIVFIVANDLIIQLLTWLHREQFDLADDVQTWPARLALGSMAWLMSGVFLQVAWWGVLAFLLPLLAGRDALKAVGLGRENSFLASAARTDTLTGLGNRLRLNEDLAALAARLSRRGGSAALLLLDLDRFKRLNDVAGHLAGDDALRRTAQALRGATRTGEPPYRFGGEEFVVILDQCEPADLRETAGRIVGAVFAAGIPHPDNPPWKVVTISAGIANIPSGEPADIDRAMRHADEALYRAKALGRNRAELADEGIVFGP